MEHRDDDLYDAILTSLGELCLEEADEDLIQSIAQPPESSPLVHNATSDNIIPASPVLNLLNQPFSSAEGSTSAAWAEFLVSEMASAFSLDDAKARASRAYEIVAAQVASNLQRENMALSEKVGVLSQVNGVLKRAVVIQHRQQKEFQDRVKALEISNYTLRINLEHAERHNSSIDAAGRFRNPDVF